MASDNNPTTGGIGIAGALLILFIALKLTHVIGWSWLWVLAPAWIPTGIVVVTLCVIIGVAVLRAIFGGRGKRTGRR